jgi:glycosyltransferase involved in cell wall biosynthesis
VNHITQLTYYFDPVVGGQQVYVEELNEVLRSLGYSVDVIQRWRRDAKARPGIHLAPAIPYGGKAFGKWDWHLFTLSASLRYWKSMATADALIIHYAVHAPAVWRLSKKVILISHGIEWERETPGLEDRFRRWIARLSFDKFTIVANDTDYLREMGITVEPGSTPFCEVAPRKWFVPNCVDIDRFRKIDGLPEYQSNPMIIVPRQITADRGIDLALRTLAEVLRSEPTCLMVVVGGPTSGKYFEFCRSLAGTLGVASHVKFVGPRSHDEMPKFMSSAKACLIPTLRREGTSLSALEAMSCGVPTVTTNVAGLRDLPSLQCAPDAKELARALLGCIADGGRIGKEQALAVRTTYTKNNWRRAWEKVLQSVLAGGENSGSL